MPQMMPLNWLMLFSFFSILMITFNVMNYYTTHNKSNPMNKIKISNKPLHWKW